MFTLATTPLIRLHSLQTLRGLAAVLVLLFHLANIQREIISADAVRELALLSGFWQQGYAGVDVFFVISGFVMVYITHSTEHNKQGYGRKNVLKFLYARMTRVFPLWWIFASLMALYFWVSYQVPADPFRISREALFPYLAKSFLLLPQTYAPVLSVGWTLVHEMYFYWVFALILLLPRRLLIHALLAWAALGLIGFASGLSQNIANSPLSLASSLLSLEFIGGALVAVIVCKKWDKYAKPILLLGTALFVGTLIFYTDKTSSMLLWGRVIMFGLPTMLLLYGLVTLERTGKFMPPTWSVKIGDWSYSLYLSHILVLSALKRMFAMLATHLPENIAPLFRIGADGILDNLMFASIGFTACIIFAAVSYRYVEKPLMNMARKHQIFKSKAGAK